MNIGLLWTLMSSSAFAIEAAEVAAQVEAAAASTDQRVALLVLDMNTPLAQLAQLARRLIQAEDVVVTPISPLGDRQREIDLALGRVQAGCGFLLDSTFPTPQLRPLGACAPATVAPALADGAPVADASRPADGPEALPNVYVSLIGITVFMGDDGGVNLGQEVTFRIKDRLAAGGAFRLVSMNGAIFAQFFLSGEATLLGDVARGLAAGLGLGLVREQVSGFFGYEFDMFIPEGRLGGRYTLPEAPVFFAGWLGYSAIFSADLDSTIHGTHTSTDNRRICQAMDNYS